MNTSYDTMGPAGWVKLGFTDNFIVNGSGFDLALFEIGGKASAEFLVQIPDRDPLSYATIWTGEKTAAGFDLNVALIDLDDFCVSPACSDPVETVSELMITGVNVGAPENFPELTLVGALNSTPVPEPATLILFSAGLLGLAGGGRMKWLKKKAG